jgi:hypothetical protein
MYFASFQLFTEFTHVFYSYPGRMLSFWHFILVHMTLESAPLIQAPKGAGCKYNSGGLPKEFWPQTVNNDYQCFNDKQSRDLWFESQSRQLDFSVFLIFMFQHYNVLWKHKVNRFINVIYNIEHLHVTSSMTSPSVAAMLEVFFFAPARERK